MLNKTYFTQIPRNSDAIRSGGDYGNTTWTSPNPDNNSMGRHLSPVEILHPTASQKNDTTLLDQKVLTLGQHDCCNSKTDTSPYGNKLNIYTKKEEHKKRKPKKKKIKKQKEEKITEKGGL
jgi:hypothetical protein